MRTITKLFDDVPGSIFRYYTTVVLLQFAVLSFLSVDLRVDPHTTADSIHDALLSSSFWYGHLSLLGAISIIFRSKIAKWRLGTFLGDLAAFGMFAFIGTEYLTSKPPIYAGGVMAGTAAALLLGGIHRE